MRYPAFVCDCLYKSNVLESLGLKVTCVDPDGQYTLYLTSLQHSEKKNRLLLTPSNMVNNLAVNNYHTF